MTIAPDRVARVDQLQAARRDNLVNAEQVLRIIGSRYPRRITHAVARVYSQQLLHHGLDGCQHLSATAPAPAWWLADCPATLRCGPCAQEWMRRPNVDAGCDLCHLPGKLRPVAVAVAPVIGRNLDGTLESTPPAVLLAGVCNTCWAPT